MDMQPAASAARCIFMVDGKGERLCMVCTNCVQVCVSCVCRSDLCIIEQIESTSLLEDDCAICGAETMSWQQIENGNTTPPALAAHTLTAVGQHGILCFGGHGKKVYNTVHKLDPTTCLWQQFKAIGVGIKLVHEDSSSARMRYNIPYEGAQTPLCFKSMMYVQYRGWH